MEYVQLNTGFCSVHDHLSTAMTVWMNSVCPVIVQVFPGTVAFHLSWARFLLLELSEMVWSKPAVRLPEARPTSLSQVNSHYWYLTLLLKGHRLIQRNSFDLLHTENIFFGETKA